MAATEGDSGGTFAPKIDSGQPPIIAMVIIAVALVTMAQFQSTERLAAAFAWLIFVAVLLANGQEAFKNLTNITSVGKSSTGAIDEVVKK